MKFTAKDSQSNADHSFEIKLLKQTHYFQLNQ